MLKVVGRWPAHRYFIVVAPSSCGMGQSLWMCCSQPQPQPVGAGQEPCGRSTQAVGHLLFRSSGHFSRMENPHLESWSPGSAGSEQPMDREEPPKPPLAQGTVTLMPIGGNNSVEPSSRDSPGQSHEEMCNTGGTKICLAPIQPWAPAGTIMARQDPCQVGTAMPAAQLLPLAAGLGRAQLSLQAWK